ncbi:uncharacterized protein [Haliotis asinina]|uniref:uncharacterized protein n=1 Tax=Haliotis asinina TaxID=109174 RepID=UPI0035321130
MEHQVFRKIGSISLYDCASECLMSPVCLSFGFEYNTLICFLHSNTSDNVSIYTRSGLYFSDIQSWPKSLAGPCFVMSCPVTTRCQVDRLGLATCVPEFTGCGHPPDIPGTSMTYNGHYQGAMARYACKEDFIVCHQKNTSVCQTSGQWGTVTDICGKFRWRNPRVKDKYGLPCGPQSNFNVFLLATATTDKRFTVLLSSGEDVTFLSEFRFNYVQSRNKIVINTRFHHRWGYEVDLPLPLTVGKESEIQISLDGGEYKLVVDDVVKLKFQERKSGVKPDGVSLAHDVVVRLMEISV